MVDWKSILRASQRKWAAEFKPEQTLAYDYYKGIHHNQGRLSNFTVDNVFLKLILTEADNLNFTNPKFIVSPVDTPLSSTSAQESSRVVAIYLDYLIRSLDIQNEVSKVVLESLLSPISFMEVNSSKVKDPKLHSQVNSHQPFVSARRPDMVLFDHTIKDYDLNRQRWIAIKELIPSKIILDKDNGYVNDPDMDSNRDIWVWNVWDRITKKIHTVNSAGTVIKTVGWPAEFKRFPIVPLWFYPNPTKIFPMTYLRSVKTTQDYLNKTLSAILNHVCKKSTIQLIVNTNKITQDREKINIDFSRDQILPVNGSVLDVARVVDKGNIGGDLFNTYQILKSAEVERLKIENSENNPGKLSKLKRFYRELGQNLLSVVRANAKNKKIALNQEELKVATNLVPGRLQGINFLSIRAEDFQGGFHLEPIIDLFSTKQARLERITSLYNLVKDNPFIRQEKLIVKLLQEFGIEDAGDLVKEQEEVQKIQEGQVKANVEAQLEVDSLKRKTDFAKTMLKETTKKEIEDKRLASSDAKVAVNAKLKMLQLLKGKNNG